MFTYGNQNYLRQLMSSGGLSRSSSYGYNSLAQMQPGYMWNRQNGASMYPMDQLVRNSYQYNDIYQPLMQQPQYQPSTYAPRAPVGYAQESNNSPNNYQQPSFMAPRAPIGYAQESISAPNFTQQSSNSSYSTQPIDAVEQAAKRSLQYDDVYRPELKAPTW